MFVTDLTVINYMYYLQILKARINANRIFYTLSSDEKYFTKTRAVLIVISSILKRGFDNQSVSNGWGELEVNRN